MTSTTANDAIIRTAEGVPLKLKLLRTTRRNRIVAFCLVVPLLLWAGGEFGLSENLRHLCAAARRWCMAPGSAT